MDIKKNIMKNILVILWISSVADAHTHPRKTDVVCVTGDEEPEIYLTCDPSGLINILSAHVGHQNATTSQASCTVQAVDDCVLDLTMLDPLLHSCMGLGSCNKVAYHPEQDNCDANINYFQVEYECIPNNEADPFSVLDVCGDNMGTRQSVTRHQGFVRSLGYPNTYSPLTSCSCNLTARDPGTSIHLTVLDMDLGPDQRASSARDWLEYSRAVEHWGEGHTLNNMPRNAAIEVRGGQLFLNFKTDSTQQGRGFWVKYEATAADGTTDADLSIHCGELTPPDHKSDITCYQDEGIGELYLSCRSQGVISIISAIRGYQTNKTFDNCAPVRNFSCSESVMDDHELFTMCMGRVECNPPARQKRIDECGQQSNYMQVMYQCIAEEAGGTSSIIDVCGDATGDTFIQRKVGFLETLNYPAAYFPNQKCTCRLQAIDEDTEIVLSLVDLSLDHAECTKTKDWIEYTVGNQNWGKGVRLCGNIPGEAIHTGARKLYTNFYSDVNVEGRGVWLKYMGKSADGSLQPVKVICGDYHPDKDLPEDVIPNYPPPGEKPTAEGVRSTSRTGLAAGLSVIAILMLCAVAGMVIYKFKRPAKKALEDDLSVTPAPSAINRFDAGYGTLKYPGFSTRKDGHGMPYTNLDDDKTTIYSRDSSLRDRSKGISRISGSSPAGESARVHDNSSGYASTCGSSEPASVRSEVAYSNPTFDESLDGENEATKNHLKV